MCLKVIYLFDRETGALCAMKEVDLIPDDPKSAECIKQLEQVTPGVSMYNYEKSLVKDEKKCPTGLTWFFIVISLSCPGMR